MKTLKTSLLLSVGAALLATPALAAVHHHRQTAPQVYEETVQPRMQTEVETYPNGATRSGSEESFESGAEFNLLQRH